MRWWRRTGFVGLTAALAVVVSAMGCSRAVYHQVRPGETLYRISKAYGVSVDDLVNANQLLEPSRIEVGQELLIPGARRRLPVDLITPRSMSARAPQRDEVGRGAVTFAWPINAGSVTSRFGQRGSSFHEGIDISAPAGTPVHAADEGEVLYSDALRGYGNVIIVRHPNGFATVYAHNQRNLVGEGQRVRQAEIIGLVGDSGHTDGANLHFEVRKDNIARDPLYFLPPNARVAAPLPLAGSGG